MVDTGKAPVVRWAASAAASSENVFFGKAVNATGPPDVTGCERGSMQVWQPNRAPQTASAAPQWLEVGFSQAERAVGLEVHEVDSAPFVMQVDLVEEDGTAHTVYQGGDTTRCGEWLRLGFPPTSYRVKKARIWTAASATAVTAEGVDAVGLLAAPAEGYQYNGFNQLVSVAGNDGSSTSFGYDGNGNQVSKVEARPGQTAQATTYVYNPDNRLVGISLPSGASNAFEYDANGLRTKKSDSGGTTSYLLDGLSVIAQYAPGGARQAWYTQSLARIDEVLSVVNASGKFWYQADALGSIYTLTTASGAVQARGGYDVFGEPVAVSGSPVGQPFGFTGREHELESALVYARARYLSPGLGRWTSLDPFSFGELASTTVGVARALAPMGVLHRYGYVDQRPTLQVDPSGELPCMLNCMWSRLRADAQSVGGAAFAIAGVAMVLLNFVAKQLIAHEGAPFVSNFRTLVNTYVALTLLGVEFITIDFLSVPISLISRIADAARTAFRAVLVGAAVLLLMESTFCFIDCEVFGICYTGRE